jgi:predicted TIM-barrel fold metal-dependent hydrolase
MEFGRRDLLRGIGAALPAISLQAQTDDKQKPQPLELVDFQPKSMLHAAETRVDRAKFAVIDVHTHLSFSKRSKNGVPLVAERQFFITPEKALAVMDSLNVKMMVNLTGGYGAGLQESVARFDKKAPGRFLSFTEPDFADFLRPDYPQFQADNIQAAYKAGARGLKVMKILGLYLRENVTTGKLVKVDDPRFDPMWDACGQLGIPVAIHVSDPVAFFLPIDRFNERFEELNAHPDWSFHGKDFPSNAEILEARNRVIAKHPKTQFLVLHVGNFAEDLDNVSAALDRFPNMTVEIGARVGELGRQPRRSRKFFDRYQDRILFGTDAVPGGDDTPQQVFNEAMYRIYFRFLETEDEYFDYAPSVIPPQGRWRIYGLGLPDGILEKVYNGNAKRLLRIS